ncbi:MAG: methyltransferase domain-containing protein [Candidatus Brocadiae bacterium]|nr:methyltransferase domain-containing protein [Candidatus Brocadiia bacterium]
MAGGGHIEWVYNFYAGVYDLVFNRFFESGRRRALAAMAPRPGEKILEVGVGTGACLPMFPGGVDLTGIDFSQGMLDGAYKRVREHGLKGVRLFKMDATKLDFPDDSFDAVLAAYFITTVPDPRAVVQEMKRVCRRGGRIVFVNHFMAPNVFINDIERFFAPFFWRAGWRSDLKLPDFLRMTNLKPEKVELVDRLGLWRTLYCVNHKDAAGPEEVREKTRFLPAALKRWGKRLAPLKLRK